MAIRKAIADQSPIWVILQQVFVRGLLALKFFVAAAIIGPKSIGYVSIALLALVIAEALSETGLQQAAVQADREMNARDAGAWITLQGVRGCFLSLILALGASPISTALGAPLAAPVIRFLSPIAIIKSLLSPGAALAIRSRQFRRVFFIEFSASSGDLLVTIILLLLTPSTYSIIVGSLVCESLKTILYWVIFPVDTRINIRWRQIAWLTKYGGWIWKSSVTVVILNQIDKILVVKILGIYELGLYQTASKIAQLLLVDGLGAYSQYLFPTFSHLFRHKPTAVKKKYNQVIMFASIALAGLIILVWFGAAEILLAPFGAKWEKAVPLVKVLSIPMGIGGIISVMVAYSRAIGLPYVVTRATYVQLLILVGVALPATIGAGITGLALSLAVAGGTAAMLIHTNTRRALGVVLRSSNKVISRTVN